MATPRHLRPRRQHLRHGLAASAATVALAACGSSEASVDSLPASDDTNETTASTAAPVTDEPTATTTDSGLGSEAAPPTEATTTTTTAAAAETTTAPTSAPEAPAGYVTIRTDQVGEGITFAIPESYDEIDPAVSFDSQADALDVDEAGRAGLFALEQLVNQADFAYIGFNFNTGSDRTDNVLAIRYPIAAAPSPADLAELYAAQTLDGGGEVSSTEVTTVDGRDAVELRLATAVDGQLLVDQAIVLVYGEDTLHELTITVARPASDEALARIATIIDSIRFAG